MLALIPDSILRPRPRQYPQSKRDTVLLLLRQQMQLHVFVGKRGVKHSITLFTSLKQSIFILLTNPPRYKPLPLSLLKQDSVVLYIANNNRKHQQKSLSETFTFYHARPPIWRAWVFCQDALPLATVSHYLKGAGYLPFAVVIQLQYNCI